MRGSTAGKVSLPGSPGPVADRRPSAIRPSGLDPDLLRELVRAAVLAPSPDNNQPWRFVPTADGIEVRHDPDRALPSDAGGLFGHLAIGAAIENIDLAARQAGMRAAVRVLHGDAERIAGVTLEAGGVEDPLYRQMLSRRTNRRLYDPSPLPERHRRALRTALDGVGGGATLTWVGERSRLRRLAGLVAAADRLRFESEPFHAELHRQLRLDLDAVERTRDGLDIRTLGVPPGTGALLRLLRPWRRMRRLNRIGASRLLTAPAALQVWASGAVGFLAVPDLGRETAVLAGRAFQRLWLAADALGLAVHPLGSLPVFLAHLVTDGGRSLSSEHRRVVVALRRELVRLVPEIARGNLAMAFRIGIARSPAVRTLRRRVDEVIVPTTVRSLGATSVEIPVVIADSLRRHDEWSYEEAFLRNRGLVTDAEQDRLKRSRVAIAGQGGVGGVHLVTLARLGIGRFTIADPDRFETVNANRQYGATRSAIGRNKAEVMAESARDINPDLDLRVMPEKVDAGNADEFLRGADVFVDGLDAFELGVRRLLFRRAAELGIPAITAGPIGFSTAWLTFHPRGMGFDRYFDLRDDMDRAESFAAFVAGLVPQATQRTYLDPNFVDPAARTGPSSGAACMLSAGVVGIEIVKLLLGRGDVRYAPAFAQFDPYLGKCVRGRLRWGNRGPLQRLKRRLIERHLRRLGA